MQPSPQTRIHWEFHEDVCPLSGPLLSFVFPCNSSHRSSLERQSLPPQLSKPTSLCSGDRNGSQAERQVSVGLAWGSPHAVSLLLGVIAPTACCLRPEDSCHIFYPAILLPAGQYQLFPPTHAQMCFKSRYEFSWSRCVGMPVLKTQSPEGGRWKDGPLRPSHTMAWAHPVRSAGHW